MRLRVPFPAQMQDMKAGEKGGKMGAYGFIERAGLFPVKPYAPRARFLSPARTSARMGEPTYLPL